MFPLPGIGLSMGGRGPICPLRGRQPLVAQRPSYTALAEFTFPFASLDPIWRASCVHKVLDVAEEFCQESAR